MGLVRAVRSDRVAASPCGTRARGYGAHAVTSAESGLRASRLYAVATSLEGFELSVDHAWKLRHVAQIRYGRVELRLGLTASGQ